nr:MMPL family transporter [uncultured Pseudomonas sp.]
MFNGLVVFSVKRPWWVILVSLIVFGLFASQLPKLQVDGRVEALVPEHNAHVTLRNEMEKVFGAAGFIIISVSEDEVFSQPVLASAYALSKQLSQSPHVREVHSIFSKQYLQGGGGTFEVGQIVDDPDSGRFNPVLIEQRLASDPVYSGNLLSLDGKGLALLVEFNTGTADQVATELVEQALEQAGLQGRWPIAGLAVIQHEMKRYMDRDMGVLMPLFLVVLAALLFLSFHTARGVLVPFAPILLAVVASTGLMSMLGIKITMITNLVPMLIIAVGSSYSIHFLNEYYRQVGMAPEASSAAILRATGQHIGPIILLAAATTFLGFISNIFNPIVAIRDFATTLGFAVVVLWLANLTLLPAIVSLLKPVTGVLNGHAKGRFNRLLDRVLELLGHGIVNRRWWVLGLGALLVGSSAYYLQQVKVESSGLSFFKEDSNLVRSSRAISQSFGGVVGFNFVIDTGKVDGAKDPAVLSTLAAFKDWLHSEYGDQVKVTLSLADYIKQMSGAYNGDKSYHRIPESAGEVAQYIEIFSWGADVRESLRNVVDEDFRLLSFGGRFALIEYPDGSYREESLQNQKRIIDAASAWLKANLPAGVEAKPYGDIMIVSDINDSIIRGQIISVVLALICVLVVTTLVFRSLLGGIISLIPVSLAVVVNFGFMGLFGIPLNIATALVSAMAIGIGIDDTIHFLMTFQQQVRQHGNYQRAFVDTLQQSGRAIIYTSLALIGGYLVLMVSPFTPIIYFGVLNIVTILFATLGTLLLLGAVILVLQPRFLLRGAALSQTPLPELQPRAVKSDAQEA